MSGSFRTLTVNPRQSKFPLTSVNRKDPGKAYIPFPVVPFLNYGKILPCDFRVSSDKILRIQKTVVREFI